MAVALPPFSIENELHSAGVWPVAGIDEAGRGPLFGPLTLAAVILDPSNLPEAYDSKKLTAARREDLVCEVREKAVAWAVAQVPARTIDALGMARALRVGALDVADRLASVCRKTSRPVPHMYLLDGPVDFFSGTRPARCVVKGEQFSRTIAAASLLAKTERDREIHTLAAKYPHFSFDRHNGYPTPAHLAELEKHGPTSEHRFTFAPLRHTHTRTD